MAIFDIFKKKTPEFINVAEQKQKPVKEIESELVKQIIERIRETLRDWVDIVTECEDPNMPEEIKYHNLFNMYYNIELDGHVSALTETILNSVTQTKFNLVDDKGENDTDVKKLFERSWFYDFIMYALEADYWLFSLIQFKPIIDGTFSGVELIDRYHVRPKGGYVSVNKFQNTKDFVFTNKPYSDWTMLIWSKKHLGRYNTIAKRFIMKREVVQLWAVFNELFTTPYFTVQTDLNNKNHRTNLLNMLESRKHSGFAVVGTDDIINAISNGGSGYQSYSDFEDKSNQEMSKAFLGQTMVFEDGSSRSQAEVHERQKDIFINARLVLLSYIINEDLIPKMRNLGISIPENYTFEWVYSKQLGVQEWVDVIVKLAPTFDFDVDEIISKIGINLEKKEQLQSQEKNIKEKISNEYNHILNVE